MIIRRLRRAAAALAFGALLAGGLAASAPQLAIAQQRAGADKPPFAHIGSDVPHDESVVFGVLPNGMRYALKKNNRPEGAVSLRFRIGAGSAHEAPDQLGLAHFIEHMAFNGTTNVEEAQVFRIMERLGARMGADTNAMTSQRETIYLFDLPKADEESIDTALMLFRETASEILFRPDAVDRERGVVLSEERGRDNPSRRATVAVMAATFGEHPMARDPIGSRQIIETAPPERLRAFYDAYYRPENAVLVIVGDIDPAEVEAKIRAKFSDWRGRGPAGADLPPLDLDTVEPGVTTYVEKGVLPQVGVSWISAAENPPDTAANVRIRIIEALGFAMLNRRFSDVAAGPNPPFVLALASSAEQRGIVRQASLITAGASDVEASIRSLIAVQRQAVEHGFRQDELERAITEMRRGLQNSVASAATRPSPGLAMNLISAIAFEQSFRAPDQMLAEFEAIVPTVTLAQVDRAVRARFSGEGPYLIAMDETEIAGGKARLEQVFAEANTAPVTALARAETREWPYTDFGAAGKIASRSKVEDLDLTFITFENGVRLTVKPTDFTKDQIQVRVMFGRGELDLPRDRASPAQMWSAAFVDGGLGKMTALEQQRAFSGRSVNISASVGEAGFILGGNTRPADFELQMQLLAAYMTDAAWIPPGYDRQRTMMATVIGSIDTQPSGVYSLNGPLLLHSGDQRWAPPTPELLRAFEVADIRSVMAPIIETADMEVVIVGEVDIEQAIALTAKTFGALPRRAPRIDDPASRVVTFPAGTPEPLVYTHKGRADQGMVVIAWPATGYWPNPPLADQLRILQIILTERVNEELRENQGKSYGVGGDAAMSRAYHGYGMIILQTEMSAEVMPAFFAAVDEAVADLQTNGPTADELSRAIRTRRAALDRTFRTNAYWSSTLMGVQLEDRRVQDLRRNDHLYEAVSIESIRDHARQWLPAAKAWKMTIVPESTGTVAASGE